MSSFVIKIIAIISMIFDHASDAIIGHFSFFNLIGRIAFPLFCFQLVNGFKHTKNIYKYMLRLIIFGIISQIPFSIFIYFYSGSFITLNIFFTLALGLLAIYLLGTRLLCSRMFKISNFNCSTFIHLHDPKISEIIIKMRDFLFHLSILNCKMNHDL